MHLQAGSRARPIINLLARSYGGTAEFVSSQLNVLSLAEDVCLELIIFDAASVVFVDHLEEGVDVFPLNGDLKFGDEVCDFIDGEVTTLVKVEIVEDLAEEGGVSAGKFKDAGLDLTEQVGDGLLGDLRVFLLGYLPGGFHHADEVLVRRSAHGEVSVVIAKFCVSYNTVLVSFSAFEVGEEVGEDLVTGLASLKELGVH